MKKINSTPAFSKIISFALIFCFYIPLLCANSLPFANKTALFDHLCEVNKEWLKQDVNPSQWCSDIFFKTDIERIQLHLQMVESILRQRAVDHLTTSQIKARFHQLDVLKKYWQREQFPVNSKYKHRQPCFVDELNTVCAVGYLVLESGEKELVKQIQKQDNYAFLKDMNYPELSNWASANGFTLDELAWIQPGYPPLPQQWESPGSGGPTNGPVHVMKTNDNGDLLYFGGGFTTIDGITTNGLAAWDGTNWHTFGNALEGAIYDMELSFWNRVYVVGYFTLNGIPTNVAFYQDGEWTPLQTGDMEGTVYAIKYYFGRMYIGGDFQKVNGLEMSALAYLDNGHWVNHGKIGSANIPDGFAVDGTVRCFEENNNKLLVGGDFSLTAPDVADPQINQLNANHLAYWDGTNWILGFEGAHPPVRSLKILSNNIYIGSDAHFSNSVAMFSAGLWSYISEEEIVPGDDGGILDFIVYKDHVYFVGDFTYGPFVGNYGDNIARFFEDLSGQGMAFTDQMVRAGAVFQDQIYFAGDFTQIGNGAFTFETQNGIVYSSLDGLSSTNELKNNQQFSIYQSGSEVIVNYSELPEKGSLGFYDLAGRLVHEVAVSGGSGQLTISHQCFSTGALVYHFRGNDYLESGKLVIRNN